MQEIYQAIIDYENSEVGYKRIEVQHNVQLEGKTGNIHQIDVFWSFELAGLEYKTLVEVKDWKSQVKKEQLHSFKAVLDDIPGAPRGCFVSKGGFQIGAINPNDVTLLANYASYAQKYAEAAQAFAKWEDEDLNDAELAYYIDVQTRVNNKLLEVAE